MKIELSDVANALVSQSSMFQCSLKEAWEKYTHPIITDLFSYEEVKMYIDETIKLGEVFKDTTDNK